MRRGNWIDTGAYNQVHNNAKLFDGWANIPLTTS